MITPDLIQRENRKTLILSIMKDGRVIVKAPKSLKDDVIDKFVLDKQKWLNSKLAIIKSTKEQFSDCINYQASLVYGEKYQIYVGEVKRVMCDSRRKCIVVSNKLNKNEAIAKIKNWYKVKAKEIVLSRIEHISHFIKIQYNSVKLSNAKGKWGSCNSKRNITINWRIVMLSPELIDYIIIHELCHIKEMNHSQSFWKMVGMFLPGYMDLRKKIKKYSFALELYR